jgi:hypothetical protein
MLTVEQAKTTVHESKLRDLDILLIILAIDSLQPRKIESVKNYCKTIGYAKLAQTNISSKLSKSAGLAARTPEGWELQKKGITRVQELALSADVNLVVTHSSRSLRSHANSINDNLTKSFVMEAIHCFEAHQFRAAVLFSWAGAVAIIHNFVFRHKLVDFNTEASRRDAKWRQAKQQDDLGRMGEHQFLDVCEVIGVMGKNVKQILQNECLMLRNTCGHPNSASIAENSVAAHIEKLIKNVFSKFN